MGKHASGSDGGGGITTRFIRPGGMVASAFNLASATLGASTIALPGAFAACGYITAIIFLLVCASCTIYSIRLLCVVEGRTGLRSYEEMGRILLGARMDRVASFLMFTFCFGTAVAYVISVSELLKPLLRGNEPDPFFANEWGVRVIVVAFWSLTMFPLSLMKEINSLRYASFFGVCAILYFIGTIVAHSASHGLRDGTLETLDAVRVSNKAVMGLSLIMFAFCCQPNVFEIYSEMKPHRISYMAQTGLLSMSCCTFLYIIAGFFGYADFGNAVHGAILADYHPQKNVAIFIAYLCLTVKLTAAFSLNVAPCRDTILYSLNWGDYHRAPAWKRLLVSATVSVLALLGGIFIPDLEVVFGFLGGLCGSMIGFILPALFAFYSGEWTIEKVGLGDWLGSWLLLLLGIATGVFGTTASIYQLAVGDT